MPGLEIIIFGALALIAVASAVMMITTRNAVHSALFIASTMISLAVLYVEQQAPFLGMAQIVVSTGAVTAVTSTAGPAGKGICATEAAAARGTSITVLALRAFGNCEIDRRFDTLNDLTARINASKVMTSSDASALKGGKRVEVPEFE